MHTGFWWGNLEGGGQLENLGVDGFIQINLILDIPMCYNNSKNKIISTSNI